MKFEAYLKYFEGILTNPELFPAYSDPAYLNYTKLNWTRTNRWLKKFEPTEETKDLFSTIDKKQSWILITEPWCGDAAHSVPQIYNLVKDNAYITLEVQLRDCEPFLIDSYLTNGGKSIPKLIIRDESGNDLATWGPRPQALQDIFEQKKIEGVDFEEIKEYFQKWYNEDRGRELQKELKILLNLMR